MATAPTIAATASTNLPTAPFQPLSATLPDRIVNEFLFPWDSHVLECMNFFDPAVQWLAYS
ncbi:Uu.00g142430.m01.CDS01 [Anthostomella pinea]|uniref:Uu.00g142430.m01.CDS01 n=1 Tax=Anthostomella pinea TaxID=933095 RepID=A0AAI8VQH2_9PEZI|nr:Uu.00g142430.m01.CDS01 [Anthostomella pinea]